MATKSDDPAEVEENATEPVEVAPVVDGVAVDAASEVVANLRNPALRASLEAEGYIFKD